MQGHQVEMQGREGNVSSIPQKSKGSIVYVHTTLPTTLLYGDTVPGACQVRVSHCPCVFQSLTVPGTRVLRACGVPFRSVGEVVLLSADCTA